MGLFKPVWQIKEREKRAKALDRMNDQKLCAVALNMDVPYAVRQEACSRMSEETLMRLASDPTNDFWVCAPAAELLKNPENQAAVATDSRLDSGIRIRALQNVRNEKVLTAVIRSDWASRDEKKKAINRLQNAALITDLACEQDITFDAVRRLRDLDADHELRRLILSAENMDPSAFYFAFDPYKKDAAFLTRVYNEARSGAVREEALEMLVEKGWEPAGVRQKLRKEIQERLRTGQTDGKRMKELFSLADRNEPLTDPERQYLYNVLRSDPFCWYATEFLNDCGDPAGMMFFRFYEALERELPGKTHLSDEEVALVLQIPEDLAVTYLKAFAKKGDGGNGNLGGPRTMLFGCARAVRLMHERGAAREQIEKEFPQSKHYRIEYTYQDSENDIRDDTDEFTAVFWE